MTTLESNNFNVGEAVGCPLVINGKLVTHDGYNIPTVAIIESINGNYVTVKDKHNVFKSMYSLNFQQLEKILLDINGKEFYDNMIENSKKFNKSLDYRFSYGPAAANLYYLYKEIDYCLTFDYAYDSLYFRGTSNLLNINLYSINIESIKILNDDLKIIFKNMVNEMVSRSENFTFSNVPILIDKLKSLC